jgi:hypothetical protein
MIPAPCVFLLEQLFAGSGVMKEEHQDYFYRGRKFQAPASETTYIVNRLRNGFRQDIGVEKVPASRTIFLSKGFFEIPGVVEERGLPGGVCAQLLP